MHLYELRRIKTIRATRYAVKVILIVLFLIGIILILKLLTSPSEVSLYKKSNVVYTSGYYVSSPEIPKELDFAGEPVPLDKFDVYESLDREMLVNTYFHSQTILSIKRMNRFFPVIEPILKKYQIPDDFKYLLVVESNFTNSVSPAGATGFWQFMKATAQKYGLEINEEVDERYHLIKATEAACKHLKDLYKYYKSWTLAAAAYNAGTGNIDKVTSLQKTNNYYDLYLNEETARYVFRILAMKIILSNPKQYGFYIPKKNRYFPIPTEKISIDSSITDLPQFAINLGINYKLLRLFNPWIRKYQLTNKEKKVYVFEIPKKEFRDINKLMQLFDLSDTLIVIPDTIN